MLTNEWKFTIVRVPEPCCHMGSVASAHPYSQGWKFCPHCGKPWMHNIGVTS